MLLAPLPFEYAKLLDPGDRHRRKPPGRDAGPARPPATATPR